MIKNKHVIFCAKQRIQGRFILFQKLSAQPHPHPYPHPIYCDLFEKRDAVVLSALCVFQTHGILLGGMHSISELGFKFLCGAYRTSSSIHMIMFITHVTSKKKMGNW